MAARRIQHALDTGYTQEGDVNGVTSILLWSHEYPRQELENALDIHKDHIEHMDWGEEQDKRAKEEHDDRERQDQEYQRMCSENSKYREAIDAKKSRKMAMGKTNSTR